MSGVLWFLMRLGCSVGLHIADYHSQMYPRIGLTDDGRSYEYKGHGLAQWLQCRCCAKLLHLYPGTDDRAFAEAQQIIDDRQREARLDAEYTT